MNKWMILFLTAWSSASLADVVTLRADPWCPYTCDSKSDSPGFMVEIVKQALEPLGHKVEYKELNWARAIAETRKGKYNAIVGAAKTDAPDFIFPEVAQGQQNMCFFTLAESKWKYENVDSLTGIVIGAITDYSYGDELDQYIKLHGKDPKRVDLVGGEEPMALNVKKLNAQRISAFIDDLNATQSYLSSLGAEGKSIKASGCASRAELFAAFSPKNPRSKQYAEAVQKKMTAMRKDGSLKKLLHKYMVEDWAK